MANESAVRTLARNIYRNGGFCSSTHMTVTNLKALAAMKPRVPGFEVVRCPGTMRSLGKLVSQRGGINSEAIREPGKIFVAETGNGHFFDCSVNGYLGDIPPGSNSLEGRDRENLVANALWVPPPSPPRLKTFAECFPAFAGNRLEQAVRVAWFTGTKTASASISAGFLLPRSDFDALIALVRKDPNNLHRLLATLWPGYTELHPKINSGKIIFDSPKDLAAPHFVQQGFRPPRKTETLTYTPESDIRAVDLTF